MNTNLTRQIYHDAVEICARAWYEAAGNGLLWPQLPWEETPRSYRDEICRRMALALRDLSIAARARRKTGPNK